MHAQFVPAHVLPNEKIVQVATGNNHMLVLTSSGHIYSWGAGEQGQLGRRVVERRKAAERAGLAFVEEPADMLDARGYADGVKVARKISKANTLGKAAEYIRVLKRREARLERRVRRGVHEQPAPARSEYIRR